MNDYDITNGKDKYGENCFTIALESDNDNTVPTVKYLLELNKFQNLDDDEEEAATNKPFSNCLQFCEFPARFLHSESFSKFGMIQLFSLTTWVSACLSCCQAV